MQIPVIIMGAAGRMGGVIRGLVESDASCRLAALVDVPARAASLAAGEDVVVSANLDDVLSRVRDAVVIDFTSPENSLAVAAKAAQYGAAHVIGTTGLTAEQRAELEKHAAETAIFWSPNMSVGVNVLAKLLPELARMLGDGYDMEIMEIHHKHKKDAPSGTALRLAEALAEARDWDLAKTARCSREGITGERAHDEIGLQALRGGDVAGIHTVYFLGSGERIEVSHHAHSRDNFAQGAVRAAKWLYGKKPGKLYTMSDLF